MKFSCSTCAAKPVLQDLNGCFTDYKWPVDVYDGFEFTRCPVTYLSARTEAVAEMGRTKYLESFTGRELHHLPAKRVEAVRYVAYLLELKAAQQQPEVPDGD